MVTSMKRCAFISWFVFLVVAVCGLSFGQAPAAPIINVVTSQYNNGRTGQNIHETILTPTNVNATGFGKIFSYSVDGNIYAQPLYVGNVFIGGKAHNVVYVATENDTVYAFDADDAAANPNPLWKMSVLSPPNVIAYPCLDNHKACTIFPVIGITGTPVINRPTNTMYFVARTKEVVSGQANPFYFEKLHAIDIRNGKELAGSPVTICGDFAH